MAGLAHDLTNHLGVIETSAHLARTSPEKHLARIEEQVRHAQALLRVVMSVARGDSPTMRAAQIGELMSGATAVAAVRVARVPPAAGASIVCEPTLVTQALANLLRNAVEAAGPDGTVDLSWHPADPQADPADAMYGAFVVRDDGPGFPEGFDVEGALTTTKQGGTGLGLVVARAVAALHGGGVGFTRHAGKTLVSMRIAPPRTA